MSVPELVRWDDSAPTPAAPQAVRDAVQPHLDRWLPLCPSWLRELNLAWDPSDIQNDARTKVGMDYRRATIAICPSWLTRDEDERSRTILHEILHIVTEPTLNVANDMLARLKEKFPDLHDWAEEQYRYANESVMSDLEWALRGARA